MLYRASAMHNYRLRGKDGDLGTIKDIYFDDIAWVVRYVVVDTGTWLVDRCVLIAPEALSSLDQDNGVFNVDLTRKQVEDSPLADARKPVSRQHEEQVSGYYGWYPYWNAPVFPWTGAYTYPAYPAGTYPGTLPGAKSPLRSESKVEREIKEREKEHADPHLRSFEEVKGYRLEATDGDIGATKDLLLDPTDWRVTHLLADVRKWWPGGDVIIDKAMILDIDWLQRHISVDMTKQQIQDAPKFDPAKGFSDDYKLELSEYYRDLYRSTGSHAENTLTPDPGM